MIEGIHEKDLQNLRLVGLILDGGFQVSTTWKLKKELSMLTSAFLKNENQYLLAKVDLYTPKSNYVIMKVCQKAIFLNFLYVTRVN